MSIKKEQEAVIAGATQEMERLRLIVNGIRIEQDLQIATQVVIRANPFGESGNPVDEILDLINGEVDGHPNDELAEAMAAGELEVTDGRVWVTRKAWAKFPEGR